MANNDNFGLPPGFILDEGLPALGQVPAIDAPSVPDSLVPPVIPASGFVMPDAYIDQIKDIEGFAPKATWDYKQYSVGYGTRGVEGETITPELADRRLRDELAKAARIVDTHAPDAPEGVKAALTSLTFNAGDRWVTSGLGDAVRKGDYERAKAQFARYTKAGGQDLPGLVSRRQKELAWFDAPSSRGGSVELTSDSSTVDLPPGFTLDQPAAGADTGLPPGFTIDAPKPEPKKDAAKGQTFGQAFGRGVDQMQGMLYGGVEALGEATGSKTLTQFGKEGRTRNEDEAKAYGPAAEFSKIRGVGDFGQWAKEIVGSQIPIMGPMLGGALAGSAVAGPIGGVIGAFVPGFVMSTGEVQSNIKEKDPNAVAPSSAFVGGAAIAALDSILPGKIGSSLVRRFGAEAAEEIAKRALSKPVTQGMLVKGAKGVVTGMATEGVTEALQEAIGDVAAAYGTGKPLDPALGTKMLEAGAAGALMGGIMGPFGGAPVQSAPADDDKTTAPPVPPSAAQTPPQPTPASSGQVPPPIPQARPEEATLLQRMGYSPADIAAMTRAEVDAELANAQSAGVTAPQARDAPSAEPIADLAAQIADVKGGSRQGVFLSQENLANVETNPAFVETLGQAIAGIGGADIVENIDGKGGVLVAKDKATADAARAAISVGVSPEAVIGLFTGSGTGKAPGADTVVQQRTPEGAVTRETLVPAAEAPAAAAAMAADGRTVETLPAQEALARRDEQIAAEKEQTIKLYRGAKAGVNPRDTSATTGAALFYAPDRAVAEAYAGKDGTIIEDEITFKNLLTAPNWHAAAKMLGSDRPLPMDELIEAARKAGHDGITFKTKWGDEYIHIAQAPAPDGDGSRQAPVKVEIPEDVAAVAKAAAADYTPAQGEANNRKLGHAKWNGLDISIETEAGGVRKGVDKTTGEPWETTMGAAYGYIKGGAKSGDGMALDVFMGTDPASDRVWVIDEITLAGKWRQHKAMIAFPNREAALAAYTGTSSKTPGMIGAVTEMPVEQFRAWAREGAKTKPLAYKPPRKAKPSDPMQETALSFIRNAGGIRPDAELRQIIDRARIPGLLNRNGLSPDDMLRALEEQSFIQDRSGPDRPIETTLDDLYDLVGRIVNGERVGRYGTTVPQPMSRKAEAAVYREQVMREIENEVAALGVRYDFSEVEEDRLFDLVANQAMDIGDAIERVAIESIENEAAAADDGAGRVEDSPPFGGDEREPGQEAEAGEPGGDAGPVAGEEVVAAQEPAEDVTQAPETGPLDAEDVVVTAAEPAAGVPTFADAKVAVKTGDPLKVIREYLEGKGWPARWAKLSDEQRRTAFAEISGAKTEPEAKPAAEAPTPAPTPAEPETPAVADRGGDRLKDYAGIVIDGYIGQEPGGERDGSVKRGFLSDARAYLLKVSKELASRGFAPYEDRKGKPQKPVSVNPAGPAVSGDVSLSLIDNDANGIYVNIGTALTGPKGGISLLARRSTRENQYSSGQNQWLSVDLTVKELADRLEKIARPAAQTPAPAVTTEPSGQTSLVPEATTSEKIAAESKAKSEKGKAASDDAGPLFNPDAGKQTDLVDMAKAPKDEFDPAQHVKLVADDISKVRKSDVERLFQEAPRTREAWTDLRVYIAENRPDLVAEALDAIGDLGGLPKSAEEIARADEMVKNREERAALNRRIVAFIQDYLRNGGTVQSTTVYRIIPLTKPEHIRIAKDGTVQIPERSKWVSLFDSGVDDLAQQAGWKDDAKPADDLDALFDEAVSAQFTAPAPTPAPVPETADGIPTVGRLEKLTLPQITAVAEAVGLVPGSRPTLKDLRSKIVRTIIDAGRDGAKAATIKEISGPDVDRATVAKAAEAAKARQIAKINAAIDGLAPKMPGKASPKKAATAAKSAAKNIAMGLDEVASGLTTLFGNKPGRLGSGPSFDEATYAKAVPFFKAGVAHFQQAGADIRTAMRELIRYLAETAGMSQDAIVQMKPYVVRFVSDMRDGTIDGEDRAPSRDEGVERDRRDGPAQDGLGEADVPPAAGPDGESTRDGREAAEQGGSPRGGRRVPARNAAALGEGSDRDVQGGAPGADGSIAGSGERAGSGDAGVEGVPAGQAPAAKVGATASNGPDLSRAIEAQRRADETVRYVANDAENIRAALPLLKPAQQDDVIKAEARFSKPDGHGFLFTNGTGTGKTFTGLGVIKRFVAQGKSNILVLAPSQGIIDGWIASGRMIGLDLKRLDDTKSAGTGIVATTYANLRENIALADRDWDLLVADEAHHLSQDKSGSASEALSAFRGLSGLRPGNRAGMRLQPLIDEIKALEAAKSEKNAEALSNLRKEYARQFEALRDEFAAKPRAKALFLSATPFAYRKSTDWAEGFLFSYPETKGTYNNPGGQAEFLVRNFGYNMRYNRAEEPGPEVNVGVLEREFYERLKRDGVLSGRRLEVEADYDRRFVLVDDAVGAKIDQALEWLWSEGSGRYTDLREMFLEQFNYLSQRRLLEAIKAKHAIPRIKRDLELGRKVVVFHDYNEGGGLNPFAAPENPNRRSRPKHGEPADSAPTYGTLYDEFVRANPYVKRLDFSQFRDPITTLTEAFPDALVYNGRIPNKKRAFARDAFNKDGSGRDIIIVQSAAGEAGISLHDTTGKHQRVLYNLGLPTRPTTAIQQEGRIYREGQVSDAILRYMSTGTGWERTAFAQTIAERASTAENLALGEEARALRESFVDAFNEADEIEQGAGEGTGGKARDRTMGGSVPAFERAKAFYFAEGKKRGRRDQREGIDYFPTPEPIGLKMVEFADAQIGERILEPSAGHGAVARWLPEGANRFLIEPSSGLAARAGLASPGAKVITGRFEDHYIGNKYDAIVMNPPFGSGGKDAFDHLQKAVGHLREGGRIVAIVPRGGMADKRLDAFRESDQNKDIYVAMDVELPTVMFERAGTKVATRMLVLEKHAKPDTAPQPIYRDLSDAATITELFDRIEGLTLPPRQRPSTAPTGRVLAQAVVEAPKPAAAAPATAAVKFKLAETKHGKTGADLYVASIAQFVPKATYEKLREIAKKHDGFYSSFKGAGAIPGFQFPTEDARSAFLRETTAQDVAQEIITGKKPGAPTQEANKTSPPSTKSKAVNDFAKSVDDLKNKLGVQTRPLNRGDDDFRVRSLADDGNGRELTKLSDRIKAMTKGSRVQVVAEHAATFVAEAEAIFVVAGQQTDIDPNDLSISDLTTLATALFDLKQIIDQKVQSGYALADDVQVIRDLLSDRMDELSSRFDEIASDAETIRDDLNSKWDEIEERIDEIDEESGRDTSIEDETGTEVASPSEQVAAYATPAEYDAINNKTDVFLAEEAHGGTFVASLQQRAEALIEIDISELSRQELIAAQARIEQTVVTSVHLMDWMKVLTEEASEASTEVFDVVNEIEDGQIRPAVDRLENIQSDIDDSLEAALDAKEIAEGKIIEIDGEQYGPSLVRGLIASWEGWMREVGPADLEKAISRNPSYMTPEVVAERKKNIARTENNLAQFKEALAKYEAATGARSVGDPSRPRISRHDYVKGRLLLRQPVAAPTRKPISQKDYVKGRMLLRQPVDMTKDAERIFALMAGSPSMLPANVPEIVPVAFLPKKGSPKEYTVVAMDKFGREYRYDDEADLILKTQGMYLLVAGQPVVSLSSLDLGGDLVQSVVGVRAHEAVHALRVLGYLPGSGTDRGSIWGRLVGHADSLGVLSMSRKELYTRMNDPRVETASDEVTTLEVYTELYGNRPYVREILDQEAVAHMVEVYKLGGWTAQEIEPIRDILDRLDAGEIARSERTALTVDMLRAIGGSVAATADREALSRAMEMDATAPDREADPDAYEVHRTRIWDETGWYKGVDGQWRFEIPDRPFIVREGVGYDRILHANIAEAYVDAGLDEIAAGVAADDTGARGRTILNDTNKDGEDIGPHVIVIGPRDTWKVTALHELQHLIQEQEGFAVGGNAKSATMYVEGVPQLQEAVDAARAHLKASKRRMFRRIPLTPQWRAVRKAREDVYAADKALNEALDRVGATSPEQRYALYQRLAGEVEARMVEKRLGMTAKERRARPPWLDYDVPESDQIVVLRLAGDRESAGRSAEADSASLMASAVPASGERMAPDAAQAIKDAVSIVARIAGRDVAVRTEPRLPEMTIDGQTARPGGLYQKQGLEAKAVVTLAYADPRFEVRTVAGHEAYHHVESELASPAEMALLRSPAEMERATRHAAAEIGRSLEETRKLPDYEIRAIAFQRYRRMREEGMTMTPLHIGIRRLWDAMVRLVQGVKNALQGKGFDSMEAIFERARTGEMVTRAAERRIDATAVPAPRRGRLDRQMVPAGYVAREPFDLAKVREVRRYVSDVPLADIRTVQPSVGVASTKAKLRNPGSDGPVSVFKWDGLYYVNDGNHRIEAARATRTETVRAEVIELAPRGNDADVLADRRPADAPAKRVGAQEADQDTGAEALARQADATLIEHIGKDDPHPGRVLAFHGSDATFDRFDLAHMRSFGVHFGGADLAELYVSPSKKVTTSRIIPAVLDLPNVLTLPDMDRWNAVSIAKAVEVAFPFASGLGAEIAVIRKDAGEAAATEALRQRLTSIGVHGIRYWNEGVLPGWAYIVWEKGRVTSPTSGETLMADLAPSPADQEASRRERISALGFDTSRVLYHGTMAFADGQPLEYLRPRPFAKRGPGVIWLTPARGLTDYYNGSPIMGPMIEGGGTIPVYIRPGKQLVIDAKGARPFSIGAAHFADEIEKGVSTARSALVKRLKGTGKDARDAVAVIAELPDAKAVERWMNRAEELGGEPERFAEDADDLARAKAYYYAKAIAPDELMALFNATDNPLVTTPNVFQWARDNGYDSVSIRNMVDVGGRQEQVVVFDPANIRSVNAGFDPTEVSSPNLMASIFPTATSPGTFFGRRVAATMRRMAPRSDQWRVRIQDKFLMMRRQQEAIERQTGASLPLPLDVYVAESLYHGRAGERMADLQQKRIEPLVEHLRKNEIDADALGEYLYARHAGERNAYIRTIDPGNDAGSGMTDAESQQILARISSGPKAQAFADAAAMVDRINAETRDTLLAAGLISRETYDAWSTDYQHYVPLRGFEANEEESVFPRVGKGFNVRGPEAFRALGRRSKSDNPVAYVLLQAQQAIVRAEKNRVNKTLLRLVETHPDPDVWQVYRGETKRVLKTDPATGKEYVDTVFVPPQFSAHDPSIVGVKVGGKQHYIQVHNPNLARALRGVGSSEFDHAIVRNMMALTRFYAQLLTSWNPEFVVGNFFRDVQTALINSKDVQDLPAGARKKMLAEALSLKSIRGIYNGLRGDGSSEHARYFEEYRRAGGKISFMEFNDVERIKTRINGLLTEGNTRRAIRNVAKYVEDLNSSVENGTRLSVYIAMRKAGIAQDRAASVARELTVNFNRKGEWGSIINAAYLFFNASVQGSTRMLQAIGRSKAVRRAVYAIAFGGFAMEMLNYLVAGDDDDKENAYDKIKPWVKERNMIVMLPGRKDYLMIPMPYGYNVPYVAGQKIGEMVRSAWGHGKTTPAKAAAGIMSALMDSFNPLGTSPTVSFLQMASPTILDPVVQVAENKTWYGGPIYPTKFDRNKPDSETYFASVHPAFIEAAKWINRGTGGNAAKSGMVDVSPEVLEHYATFLGGGIAKFVLNATGTGQRALSGEEFVPEKTPILRRLYGAQTSTSRRSDFYEAWTKVDGAHYEVLQLNKAGDKEGAQQARAENKAELEAYGIMKGTQRALSQYSKQRAQIQLNREMPDAEKKAKLDEIKAKENEIILRALEVYNKAQKQKAN